MKPDPNWFSDPPGPPFSDPSDPDDNLELLLFESDEDVDTLAQQALRAEARRRHQRTRFQKAGLEIDRVTRNLAFQQRTGGKQSGLVSTLRPTPSPGSGNRTEEPMLPIFEPMHNAREMAKQLTLLEDHIIQPPKHCSDCIRKHLLTTEALAEEAVSLATQAAQRVYFQGVAQEVRGISRSYLGAHDRSDLQQRARKLRKELSKKGFSSIGSINSEGEVEQAAAEVFPAPKIVESLKGGETIAIKTPADGWVRATVLTVGQPYWATDDADVSNQNQAVESIPQGGYLGFRTSQGGYEYDQWLPVSDPAPAEDRVGDGTIVVLSPNPVSSELRGKAFNRYRHDGSLVESVVLDDQQLLMADIIQGAFIQKFGGNVEGSEAVPVSGPGLCALDGVTNPTQLAGHGCEVRVLQQLLRAAVVNAFYESGLRPKASAAGAENSIGLFQLNITGGLGRGRQAAELENPILNSAIVSDSVQRQIRRFSGPIHQEAQVAPTSVHDWSVPFTIWVERPANKELAAQARAKTADELYPPPRQLHAGVFDVGLTAYGADPDGVNTRGFLSAHPDLATAHGAPGSLPAIDFKLRAMNPESLRSVDLTPGQATIALQAGRAWLDAGIATSELFPFCRAAALYLWVGDVPGTTLSLDYIATNFAGTPQGIEARNMLSEYERTHAPVVQRRAQGMTTGQKVALGAVGALFLGTFIRSATQ